MMNTWYRNKIAHHLVLKGISRLKGIILIHLYQNNYFCNKTRMSMIIIIFANNANKVIEYLYYYN